jgi:hypothetical protein
MSPDGARARSRTRPTFRAASSIACCATAAPPPLERAELAEPHRDAILALHAECGGNLMRVDEELIAPHQLALSYPALTAVCRKHGIGHEPQRPPQQAANRN